MTQIDRRTWIKAGSAAAVAMALPKPACDFCGGPGPATAVMACFRTETDWLTNCCPRCSDRIFPAGYNCWHLPEDKRGCGNPVNAWAPVSVGAEC